jgi:hypothetical protein
MNVECHAINNLFAYFAQIPVLHKNHNLTMSITKDIIDSYINAYNRFDVNEMVSVLHPDIEFKNIANGDLTLHLQGIDAFKEQALKATAWFTQRKQTVTSMNVLPDSVEVLIDYEAILAVDTAHGLKAGTKISMKGKSIFRFAANRIVYLEDIS